MFDKRRGLVSESQAVEVILQCGSLSSALSPRPITHVYFTKYNNGTPNKSTFSAITILPSFRDGHECSWPKMGTGLKSVVSTIWFLVDGRVRYRRNFGHLGYLVKCDVRGWVTVHGVWCSCLALADINFGLNHISRHERKYQFWPLKNSVSPKMWRKFLVYNHIWRDSSESGVAGSNPKIIFRSSFCTPPDPTGRTETVFKLSIEFFTETPKCDHQRRW